MTTTTKSRIKKALLFLAGVIVGAFLAYAFMWYQVYQKFNLVYTCQIFTGALSIEEQEMCAEYDPAHKPRYY